MMVNLDTKFRAPLEISIILKDQIEINFLLFQLVSPAEKINKKLKFRPFHKIQEKGYRPKLRYETKLLQVFAYRVAHRLSHARSHSPAHPPTHPAKQQSLPYIYNFNSINNHCS